MAWLLEMPWGAGKQGQGAESPNLQPGEKGLFVYKVDETLICKLGKLIGIASFGI